MPLHRPLTPVMVRRGVQGLRSRRCRRILPRGLPLLLPPSRQLLQRLRTLLPLTLQGSCPRMRGPIPMEPGGTRRTDPHPQDTSYGTATTSTGLYQLEPARAGVTQETALACSPSCPPP